MSTYVAATCDTFVKAATRCAARMRKQLGTPDRKTAQRMARAFRSALCPRKAAGRKADRATVRAAEIWKEGMNLYRGSRSPSAVRHYQRQLLQTIYREVYPELERQDKLTRQYRTSALRRNVKSFLRRRGQKLRFV